MALPVGFAFHPRSEDNPHGYLVPDDLTTIIRAKESLWLHIIEARERHNERVIRWLLGLWVSEVEPTIHRGPHGAVVGLGHGGRIILDAPGFENGRDIGSWLVKGADL